MLKYQDSGMLHLAENDARKPDTIWMLNLDDSTPVVSPAVDTKFLRYVADMGGQVAGYGWVRFGVEACCIFSLKKEI